MKVCFNDKAYVPAVLTSGAPHNNAMPTELHEAVAYMVLEGGLAAAQSSLACQSGPMPMHTQPNRQHSWNLLGTATQLPVTLGKNVPFAPHTAVTEPS